MIHMNDPSLGRSFGDLWPKRSPSAVGKRNQIDVCFLTHETRGQAAGNPEQTAAGHGVYLLLCGRFPMSCIEVLVSRRYTRMRVHQYTRIQCAKCRESRSPVPSNTERAILCVAGETGLEPATPGFGDRCSAS